MSFFKKYKKKFVAKLRQLRKYYRYKVYFPKKYESYCNQPVQENKVLFLEMRFTTLSNSFQYLYKKLEESGEYDLKCSYVQFNFIRGREFTKRVDNASAFIIPPFPSFATFFPVAFANSSTIIKLYSR